MEQAKLLQHRHWTNLVTQGTGTILARTHHEVRSFLASYPALFFPLVNLKSRSRKLAVGKNTELVIEGFPRSANSFAVGAFQSAQSRPIAIANHLHAPAQILLAARRDIPTLVLIRQPTDAVISMNALHLELSDIQNRSPRNTTLGQLLRSYIRFYTTIMPYKENYIVGIFEEVIIDFGAVIEKVNQRFNTNFSVFNHTEKNVLNIWQDQGMHAGFSNKRQEIKKLLQNELELDKNQVFLSRANDVYHQFKLLAQRQA